MTRLSHGAIIVAPYAADPPAGGGGVETLGLNSDAQPVAPKAKSRLDYLFRQLPGKPSFLPVTSDTVSYLNALGRSMRSPKSVPVINSKIPSAYTYLGQFIIHDIARVVVAESAASLVTPNMLTNPDLKPLSPDEVIKYFYNKRTPQLELQCVYGEGSVRNGDKMALGRVSTYAGQPGVEEKDVPRSGICDDPNHDREALIADSRNDENLIVSQLHVAFLRAHNAIVDRGNSFDDACEILLKYYHWLIIKDYLPLIVDEVTINEVLSNPIYRPEKGDDYIPLEFTVAAYRFGHSMVRFLYYFNQNFAFAYLGDLFTYNVLKKNPPAGGGHFLTLPGNKVIKWENFLLGYPGLEGIRNMGHLIDTSMVDPLFEIPDTDGKPMQPEPSLAAQDLKRGYMMSIPTGQSMARALGLPYLYADEIEEVAAKASEEQRQILRYSGFSEDTPLWYYVLAEARAERFGGGNRLGPVGGRIVAEVLIGLIRKHPASFLHDKSWHPKDGDFTLRDLLLLAKVLEKGENNH